MDGIRGKKGGFDWKAILIIFIICSIGIFFYSALNYSWGKAVLYGLVGGGIIASSYGLFSWSPKAFFIIVGGLILFGLFFRSSDFCKITKSQQEIAEGVGLTNKLQLFLNWGRENIFACEKERVGIIEKTKGFFKDILGLNVSFWDFIPTLMTGALAGLLIWLIYTLAFVSNKKLPWWLGGGGSLKSSWLEFIGDAWWKVLVIGVGYAVLMQVPFLKSFIEFITFKPLLNLAHEWWVVAILRSIILAFYIGVFPGAIEAYARYKMRKAYYNALVRAKFQKDMIRIQTGV